MSFSNIENKDKFYTNIDVAKKIIQMLQLHKYDEVIEPSAGSGAFSKHMKCIALDLHPEDASIRQQDWFDYKHIKKGKLAVVGNPPFGDRNVLAKRFIKKSIEIDADMIAFVLTDTFRKPTYEKVADGYRLVKTVQLKDNSFTLQGVPYHVPCSLFVWEKNSKKKDLTWKKNTYRTHDFIFIKESEYIEGEDIAIKQAISKKMINPEKGKCYYIRPRIDNLAEILSAIDFKGYSAVNGGVIALSQEEIVRNYLEGEIL